MARLERFALGSSAIRLKLDALKASLPASLVVHASNATGADLAWGRIGQLTKWPVAAYVEQVCRYAAFPDLHLSVLTP